MGGDWKENHPRGANEGAPTRETPSDWYRRKIDEMTLHEQFVDLWDKQRDRRQGTTQATLAPWEGISQVAQSLGINLGELWKSREEQLKASRESVSERDKELHLLRVNEIDRRVHELQALAEKVEKAQSSQVSQGQKSFLEKLDEVSEGLVSKRIASMFGGGDGQDKPKDPVKELTERLDEVDKLKQRFAPTTEGTSTQSLVQSGIRGEILKLLLEDERERLKLKLEHDTQVEKNKHLGTLASTVKDNLGDGIRALMMAAQDIEKGGTAAEPKPQSQKQEAQAFVCENCGNSFGIPPGDWAVVGCPHCGTEYNRQQVLGG